MPQSRTTPSRGWHSWRHGLERFAFVCQAYWGIGYSGFFARFEYPIQSRENHFNDAEIVRFVYGGDEGIGRLIQAGREAAQSAEPVILEAASLTNDQALMYQTPYYTETHRGLIPEYDNKFNVASWEGWLRHDAIQSADQLNKPVLLVHSEAAAIPQGAREYARRLGRNAVEFWLDEVTQFDFCDSPIPIKAATDAAADHFNTTLRQGEVH